MRLANIVPPVPPLGTTYFAQDTSSSCLCSGIPHGPRRASPARRKMGTSPPPSFNGTSGLNLVEATVVMPRPVIPQDPHSEPAIATGQYTAYVWVGPDGNVTDITSPMPNTTRGLW
ncbi:Uu.00g115270.m01.CDS01 [Anthostomella pinea]|uniref:Uu.00g115270.m01.CDS01 n=1 Tax=Anthostomella pinea TaxID=933095 RepID=A0AAI8VFQ2_9PEZI|nr:Uu.00g115270.m01.CDS01 [Anthostomella pinea]